MNNNNANYELLLEFDKIIQAVINHKKGEMSLDLYEFVMEDSPRTMNAIFNANNIPQNEIDSVHRKIERCKRQAMIWLDTPSDPMIPKSKAAKKLRDLENIVKNKINQLVP